MPTANPRRAAYDILLRIENERSYADILIDRELSGGALQGPDRGLLTELVYGVLRRRGTLDHIINQFSKQHAEKLERAVLILLRLGLYQMFWLDRIPNHAAVHESVAMAKRLGYGAQAGFINAVLRGYAREQNETRNLLQQLKSSQPAIAYSHPEWLCERWGKRWGAEKMARLLEWNNTPPPAFARVNRLKIDAQKLSQLWEIEGVKFTAGDWDWTGKELVYRLDAYPPLGKLESFQQGFFYLQDPSTLLAVRELDPQPGEAVLDLCAAPGGKTTFIAQLMQNRGRVVAQDAQWSRVELIRANCARLGIECVETSRAADRVVPELSRQFDRVLVDAPCSNTGVMRRRVDLRWRVQPAEIKRLQALQLELLNRAAVQVKPGGVLVYSTCSLEAEENREGVKQFLNDCPDFRAELERELLPFVDGVDGAYVARFRRA